MCPGLGSTAPPFLLEGAQSLPRSQASSGTRPQAGPRQHEVLPLTWRGGLPPYLGTHLSEHRDGAHPVTWFHFPSWGRGGWADRGGAESTANVEHLSLWPPCGGLGWWLCPHSWASLVLLSEPLPASLRTWNREWWEEGGEGRGEEGRGEGGGGGSFTVKCIPIRSENGELMQLPLFKRSSAPTFIWVPSPLHWRQHSWWARRGQASR